MSGTAEKKGDPALELEKMEMESQQLAMIASTFANDELQSKRQTLQQYVALADTLKEENTKQREEMKEAEQESLQVVEFLRKEVERKQETIETLTATLEAQKQELLQAHAQEKDQLEGVITEKDEELARLRTAIDNLTKSLNSVAHFQREKQEMEQDLKRLTEKEDSIKEQYERELSKLRFQSLEEKVRLKNEEVALEQRFSEDVERRAYELLDEKMKKIHQENKELLEDKGLLEKELEQMAALKKKVDVDRQGKQRDLDLQEDCMDQFAKQGYRLNKEVKDLAQKNKQVESQLQSAIAHYEGEVSRSKQRYQETIDTLESQLYDAHRMIDIRNQELSRIRSLAKHIVKSRSELESFFNEALEYVRAKVAEEQAQKTGKGKATNTATIRSKSNSKNSTSPDKSKIRDSPLAIEGHSTHPSGEDGGFDSQLFSSEGDFEPILEEGKDGTVCTPRDHNSLPPIAGNATPQKRIQTSRVDISDLSWEDKERVLRILFAKINNVQSRKPNKPKKPIHSPDNSTSFITAGNMFQ